ncbi:MAG: hypothetical protein COA86_05260 [Kangiella sp.]|nr:MAG: hypothetical protein COA86_05260 [Kangiella sp.]
MTLIKTTLIVAFVLLNIAQLSAEGKHSHDFPKEIMAFHHEMSPLWHMEQGAKRTKLSCEASNKMLSLTKNIANSENLANAVMEMKKACSDNKTDIQPFFKEIHDAFHVVSEKAK